MGELEKLPSQEFERLVQMAVKDAIRTVPRFNQSIAESTGLTPPDPTDAEKRTGQHVERVIRDRFEGVTEVKGDYAREFARPDAVGEVREGLKKDLEELLEAFRGACREELQKYGVSEKVIEGLVKFI